MKKRFLNYAVFFFFVSAVLSLILYPAMAQAQQDQVQKPKIFSEEYQLLTDTDLYCSFLIWDKRLPEIQIIGSEREFERAMMVDSDTFYINKGREEGMEIGQMFLALEISQPVGKLGLLAQKKGKVRIIRLEDHVSLCKVEKGCGDIRIGHYLIPFEEKPAVLGRDEGYHQELKPGESLEGKIIYLDTDFNIVSSGHWALIDLGTSHGIKPGQQLTVFRRSNKTNLPREAIANVVVVDVQENTSTVRILSSREAVEKGDTVQVK
ncbi:MAG: hypothetical protein QME28_06235 [Candidatus Saccharicenans sp.]|nr:hypothetical protein [Candidatus Saccharicenans sp.]